MTRGPGRGRPLQKDLLVTPAWGSWVMCLWGLKSNQSSSSGPAVSTLPMSTSGLLLHNMLLPVAQKEERMEKAASPSHHNTTSHERKDGDRLHR